MWLQCEAPLIGRTPDRARQDLRQNVQNQKRESPAHDIENDRPEQCMLPDFEHDQSLRVVSTAALSAMRTVATGKKAPPTPALGRE